MSVERPTVQTKVVIPSKLNHVHGIRDLIERTADQVGFPPQEVQRIVTAAFEAIVNAVTHGSPHGGDNTIRVDVRAYSDRLVVEITDQGRGLKDFQPKEMPDTTSRGGRGVPLMRALVDEVEFSGENGGKVTLTMYRD